MGLSVFCLLAFFVSSPFHTRAEKKGERRSTFFLSFPPHPSVVWVFVPITTIFPLLLSVYLIMAHHPCSSVWGAWSCAWTRNPSTEIPRDLTRPLGLERGFPAAPALLPLPPLCSLSLLLFLTEIIF